MLGGESLTLRQTLHCSLRNERQLKGNCSMYLPAPLPAQPCTISHHPGWGCRVELEEVGGWQVHRSSSGVGGVSAACTNQSRTAGRSLRSSLGESASVCIWFVCFWCMASLTCVSACLSVCLFVLVHDCCSCRGAYARDLHSPVHSCASSSRPRRSKSHTSASPWQWKEKMYYNKIITQ